jgi:hypothetical protein
MDPKHDELVKLLSKLGDPIVAEREARRVHAAILQLYRGRDIGRDDQGFYARPRLTKSVGPAKEMRDLAAAARKAIRGRISREDWMRIWAAQPSSISAACTAFLFLPAERTLDKDKLLGSFSAPGFITVIFKPDAVLAALNQLLPEMKTRSGRKARKPDYAARGVIAAVRSAYKALTGRCGRRVISADRRAGRLVRLGQDIDRIFGTKVFPKVDSRRLKKNFGDKSPF